MRKVFWTLPPLLIVVAILFLIFKTDLVSIRAINCKTQYGPCEVKDLEVLDNFLGKNLFSLQDSFVSQSLLSNFKNRKIYVQKQFPGILSVAIEKRKPLVASATKGSKQKGLFLVDKDGMVIGFVEQSGLPQLVLPNEINFVIGQSLDSFRAKSVYLLYNTYRTQKALKGEQKEDFLEIDLPNSVKTIYPLDKDPDVLVGALQLILLRSKIDGSLPKVIDLRYSNPVLIFQQ